MRKWLAAAALVILVVLAGLAWLRARLPPHLPEGMVIDAARVERLAAEILPGVAPGPNLRGVLAGHLSAGDFAVLAPSLTRVTPGGLQGEDFRVAVVALSPGAGEDRAREEMQDTLDRLRERKESALSEVSKGPARLDIGGEPHPVMRTDYRRVEDGQAIVELLTVLGGARGPVVLSVLGTGSAQPRVERFLAGLRPVPLRPGQAGRPGGDAGPGPGSAPVPGKPGSTVDASPVGASPGPVGPRGRPLPRRR